MNLTEEHEMIRESVRSFTEDVLEPRAIDLDRSAEWPEDIIEGMAELGLFGIPFSEDYEGVGLDDLAYALEAYRAREWDRAKAGFRAYLEAQPDDGPAQVMLDRIENLRENPPGSDWDGVFEQLSK